MKIVEQKNGSWNEHDRLQIATLLIKAGYAVRFGKEKPAGKTTNIAYIEFNEQQ